jgi:hypothetical protein
VYTIYSILFIVFIILLIVTAFITVALTYFQLAVEDHRWWWRSFLCGGSTGEQSHCVGNTISEWLIWLPYTALHFNPPLLCPEYWHSSTQLLAPMAQWEEQHDKIFKDEPPLKVLLLPCRPIHLWLLHILLLLPQRHVSLICWWSSEKKLAS